MATCDEGLDDRLFRAEETSEKNLEPSESRNLNEQGIPVARDLDDRPQSEDGLAFSRVAGETGGACRRFGLTGDGLLPDAALDEEAFLVVAGVEQVAVQVLQGRHLLEVGVEVGRQQPQHRQALGRQQAVGDQHLEEQA